LNFGDFGLVFELIQLISMEKWRGKTAIVTGAAAGIGAAIVEGFVKVGINVIALDHQIEGLRKLRKDMENAPGKITAIDCDVSNRLSVENTFNIIENSFDCINILVNNAGIAM
jgi:NADP+-dependent farnesol dehydrogenase